jgi:hypothetical protein
MLWADGGPSSELEREVWLRAQGMQIIMQFSASSAAG